METGDHSKNGASPKSLTSRGNIFKVSDRRGCKLKTVTIVLCLIIAFSSCDDAPDSIAGTTWICIEGYDISTLYFKTESLCVLQYDVYYDTAHEHVRSKNTTEYTYIYDSPNVSISVYGGIATGVIKGRSMTVTGPGGGQGIFTQK
jgi:hypothetical protein